MVIWIELNWEMDVPFFTCSTKCCAWQNYSYLWASSINKMRHLAQGLQCCVFYRSVIHIWRREGKNLWRIRHRSRPHHWSKSGKPQTDQTALQKMKNRGKLRLFKIRWWIFWKSKFMCQYYGHSLGILLCLDGNYQVSWWELKLLNLFNLAAVLKKAKPHTLNQ